MDELLAIVGGSWQPLLLYPGLVTTVVLALIVGRLWRRADAARQPTGGSPPAAVFAAASTLLVAALLPLPRTHWAYPIDLLLTLALLEVPHWLRLAERLRSGAASEAAALLNVYGLLALVLVALGQAAGSLLLPELRTGRGPLRWAGLIVWASSLPPLLGLGPWRSGRDTLDDLRRVVHVALLVSVALPDGDRWGYTGLALGVVGAFGSLTLLHYSWRGDPARWELWQPLVALGLLVLVLWTGTTAWLARLR